MAFSATVRSIVRLGGSAGVQMTLGDWSGNAGDAAGTINVAGQKVWGAMFWKQDGDNTSQVFPRVDSSYSSPVTTLTIQNQDNVVTGTFFILHGGT